MLSVHTAQHRPGVMVFLHNVKKQRDRPCYLMSSEPAFLTGDVFSREGVGHEGPRIEREAKETSLRQKVVPDSSGILHRD